MDTRRLGAGVIQELDAITEVRPTWRRRWLAPLAGALILAAVLAVTFVKVPTLRPAVLGGPPPSSGFKVLELPSGVATFQTRVALSGITGLTQVSQNDGYRYLYRLPDGRLLTFLEYPVRESGISLDQVTAGAGFALQPVAVRGAAGRIQLPADAAGPAFTAVLIWIADGTFYQLSTTATDTSELMRLAGELR
ncbi:MAG TPA: hypothetical protein VM070_00650 [Candidatus Saccharimonadales bacterium]|nr:hypothetical protein [Candidatus Saccharimonadales bacterium]